MPEAMTDRLARVRTALEDRYVIDDEIGGGGMATVYLAEDTKHRRKVALKVLEPDLAPTGRDRFLREIEIVAGLSHPNILPLHDSGSAGQCLYFVMPYVEGESLRARLEREGPFPVPEAVAIAREAAEALAYAHAHGVLHRDVKPENILMEAGHAVVADFGVALLTEGDRSDRLTGTGGAPGTPLYMSPEQAGGEDRVDGRTDIYSLGCVLYEMLIGEPPFTGRSAQVIVARKMSEPVPGMRSVRDAIPESLERVTRKALARTPADRFRTAAEFSEALSAVSTGESAPATVTVGHPRRPRRAEDGSTSPVSRARATRTVPLVLLGAAAILSLVGILNIKVLDSKVHVPGPYTPSRTDFLVPGFHAVLPFFVYTLLAFVLLRLVGFLFRVVDVAARRLPGIGRSLEALPGRVSRTWWALWRPVESKMIGEGFFAVAVVAGIAAVGAFWPLLRTMWTGDSEPLSCSHRPLHRTYTATMPIVVAILAVAWTRVFGYLRARRDGSRDPIVARWGSAAWIVALFVFSTMPWQLLWGAEPERALLKGHRAYVLAEDDRDLLVYDAEAGTTLRFPADDVQGLERLGTPGHLFEEPAAFRSGQPECVSIAFR